MTIIEQQSVVPAGFDAAVFLKLATNPAAYQAKLDELNVVADAARGEQEKSRIAYELVGKADQITDLLAKATTDKKAAEDALVAAKAQAAALVAEAKAGIAAKETDFQAKIDVVQATWLEKGKEIDARETAIAAKEEAARVATVKAVGAQGDAVAAKQLHEIAKGIADENAKAAADKLKLIDSKFKEFVKQVG